VAEDVYARDKEDRELVAAGVEESAGGGVMAGDALSGICGDRAYSGEGGRLF